jgi:hypothetical protein
MQEAKLADTSKTKEVNIWKIKLMCFRQAVETQIKGACTEASTFLNYGHQTRTHLVMGDNGGDLQIPAGFRIWCITILVSYWMYIELIMFGRLKYLQLSH